MTAAIEETLVVPKYDPTLLLQVEGVGKSFPGVKALTAERPDLAAGRRSGVR